MYNKITVRGRKYYGKILYQEGIFEFVSEEKLYKIKTEEKLIKRKFIRRPPGVRVILINKNKEILLSKEYRYELEKFDFRLPGGKVFDTLPDYKASLESDTILENAHKAAIKEVKEEVGIQISNPRIYTISKAGSSIVWDLYYFIANDFEIIPNGTELEENEIVEGYVWKSLDEVVKMCLDNEISEDRTVGVLLSYILKNRKHN